MHSFALLCTYTRRLPSVVYIIHFLGVVDGRDPEPFGSHIAVRMFLHATSINPNLQEPLAP